MRQVIGERGASEEYASVPGGTTGLLTKDYKGKQADTPVYKVDTALLSELRAHERQAAEELCQWKSPVEERKLTIDATPAALELASILSREELEDLVARLQVIVGGRSCSRARRSRHFGTLFLRHRHIGP